MPPASPSDPTGSPRPAGSAAWLARAGLLLAVAVYLTYSSFGVAHPCLWGHMGHHEAEYMMRVRTTFRHHMITPATHAGFDVPPWNDYYFHHPIGYHHLLALFTLLVGDRIWTPTVLPVLTGLVTMWSLFMLVRRWWSRGLGVLAVLTWVGLPIVTSFSILTDAMFPAMACSILTCHAYLEFTERPSGRWLRRALLAQLVGGFLFWEAYFQALFHGLQILVWWATKKGRAARLGRVPAAAAWFFSTGFLAAAQLAFHLTFLWAKGMWEDFFISYRQRHGAAFEYLLDRHKQWLKILYGWPLVWIGAAWLALFLVRAVIGRARKRDQAVLIFFCINALYIYLFAAGSALHLYRVFWFSSFLVLAVTDLASDLHDLVRWALARAPRAAAVAAPAVTVAALVPYFVVESRHAYANLLESRVMMGTHGLPGYNADYPKQLFAMEVARRTGPEDHVLVHNNLPRRVEFWYYVDRTNAPLPSLHALPALLKDHPRAVVLMDAHTSPAERRLLVDLLKKHPAHQFDRYLMVDLRSNEPGFHEHKFVADRPDWIWSWFVSHRYPPMHAREVATTQGACIEAATGVKRAPGAPPLAKPPPLWAIDQVLCYHNALIVEGRAADAAALVKELVAPAALAGPPALAAAPAPPAPLGRLPWGEVVAVREVGRTGLQLVTRVSRAPAAAELGRPRWILVPEKSGPERPTSVQELGELTTTDAAPGFLVAQRLTVAAPPGAYRLMLERGVPLATLDVARVEIR